MTSESRPGYSVVYRLAESNAVQSILTIPGDSPIIYNYSDAPFWGIINEPDLINSLVCVGSQAGLPTPESIFPIAERYNGSAGGSWFTASLNGSTGYFSLGNAVVSGQDALVLEERMPIQAYNDTLVTRTVTLNGTRSLSGVTVLYIPGEDPMISRPLSALILNYSSYSPEQSLASGANAVQQGQGSATTNFPYQLG
jgi:hypothetical protein